LTGQHLESAGESGSQQPEIGDVARTCDDGIAVQDQLVCREVRERIGDSLKAKRPIIACAGVYGRSSAPQMRLGAIAV
jgi:hypothetical protein